MDIRLLVVDVDGTMTDAGVYYGENGLEIKKFSTRDAAGFFAAKKAGMDVIVLTGRESAATRRRMEELGVKQLFQGINDKKSFLKKYMVDNGLKKEHVAYIGDDLNDYSSMMLAGFVGCPADSCMEIKDIATYISPIKGGAGVVRDVVESILRGKGMWEKVITEIYGIGI